LSAGSKENDTVYAIVKVLTLLAFAGVCILSIFGNQIYGGNGNTTTTATITTTPAPKTLKDNATLEQSHTSPSESHV
jgi:hypothetical protein